MNDRLEDLKSWEVLEDGDESAGDLELVGPAEVQSAKLANMDHFFREIENIKEDIQKIKAATCSIGKIQETFLLASTDNEECSSSRKLNSLVSETNKRAQRTGNSLRLLKEENQHFLAGGSVKVSYMR